MTPDSCISRLLPFHCGACFRKRDRKPAVNLGRIEGSMLTLEDLRHDKKAAILDLARRHGARSVRVYGSVARGQDTEQSDLDLLVEWEPDRSLLDVVGLKQDLEDLLGVTVDIGSERGLHWFIRDEVLREAVPL